MTYVTKQRQLILNLVKEHKNEHVTAEELLSEIKGKKLNISRATLYRQLEALTESGLLKKIVFDNQKGACYQLCTIDNRDHFHLVCEKCGKLIHLDCHKINELVSHIEEEHHFKINSSRIVLYGICKDCENKDE